MKKLIIGLTCLCLLGFACLNKDIVQKPSVDTFPDDISSFDYSLLFVGNSLTSTNNLPNLVRDRAYENGITIQTTAVALNNYGLEDHWFDGQVKTMIETNDYDFVIIQQGPSSQGYGRSSLIQYGGYFKEVCDANDAELAYFMVWPSLQYYDTFPGVIRNYTDASNINDARLCPVGLRWQSFFDQSNDFTYYGPDGFHPSLAGSKAAAAVILQSLNIL